jgi:hypothetical protein
MSKDYEKYFSAQQWALVEALKRLSYDEGRADEAAARLEPATTTTRQPKTDPELPLDQPARSAPDWDRFETSDGQLPRGLGHRIVEQYVQSLGAATVTAKDLVRRIQSERGLKVSYNSVVRSLKKLVDEGVMENIPGTYAYRRPAKLRVVS